MVQDITVVIGPTAIGKSDFAIALAEQTGAEIISADAFQVYRYMDIGTAKVPLAVRERIPHHLIDILNPDEPWSVAHFMEESDGIIRSIRERNKPVIICGGTGFYVNAFLYGFEFDESVSGRGEIRAQLDRELAELGEEGLWQKLLTIDPAVIDYLNPRNIRRVQRALEIFYLTGQKPSEFRSKRDTPRQDCRLIGLTAPRPVIYERIEQRVDAMIRQGLVEEVHQLLKMGYDEALTSFQALGYKETVHYLKGSIGQAEMIELIKTRTRQFAKRQLTWFRRFNNAEWIEITH